MKNDENLWEEFEREINQTLDECERNKREFFNDLYVDFQRDGIEYLNRKENNSAICLMYEAFIYFLLQEEYKRCGYIRSLLNSYSNYRFQKFTSIRK